MSNAIEVQGLSKRFRLYHEKYSSLKERVLHAGHIPYEDFWALRDIELEFDSGKTFGILGRNGSGKSTLLKCIAGILQPTSGRIVVRGQLAGMLELGAGFQPELSGRDNIFLNGSLLGLTRREIAQRFDEIVEFAELEQFIDNQVKYYSSGMVVRLGFAVAVNVEPDVLLVDEVLAVGDERFQEKCLERVNTFQQEGRTIVVVSHSPSMLEQVSDEILVLDRGSVITKGEPGESIRIFRETLLEAGSVLGMAPEPVVVDAVTNGATSPAHRGVQITAATVEFAGSGEHHYIVSGESLTVRVAYEVFEPVSGATFSISLLSDRGTVIFSSTTAAVGSGLDLGVGCGEAEIIFDALPLLDGRFSINLDVRDEGGTVRALAEGAAHFEVMNPGRATGIVTMPMRAQVTVPGQLTA